MELPPVDRQAPLRPAQRVSDSADSERTGEQHPQTGHGEKHECGGAIQSDGAHVLARKTETGIAVREIWYDTEPLSDVVLKVVPKVFGLTEQQTLAIPPALHILATEGCVRIPANPRRELIDGAPILVPVSDCSIGST